MRNRIIYSVPYLLLEELDDVLTISFSQVITKLSTILFMQVQSFKYPSIWIYCCPDKQISEDSKYNRFTCLTYHLFHTLTFITINIPFLLWNTQLITKFIFTIAWNMCRHWFWFIKCFYEFKYFYIYSFYLVLSENCK